MILLQVRDAHHNCFTPAERPKNVLPREQEFNTVLTEALVPHVKDLIKKG